MRITKELLVRKSCTFDLEAIFKLNLSGLELEELEPIINECVNIWDLNLSDNSIRKVTALDGTRLCKLRKLRLNNNRLSSLGGFPYIPALEQLYITHNQIASIGDVTALAKCLPSLTHLYLRELGEGEGKNSTNPVCLRAEYRESVMEAFPDLQVLDGERLAGDYSVFASVVNGKEKEEVEGMIKDIKVQENWLEDDLSRLDTSDQERDVKAALKELSTMENRIASLIKQHTT